MIYLVIGGSGSGKSEYAEALAMSLAKGRPLYYIATMDASDEESLLRIERHRKMREGKGFITLEVPLGMESLINGTVRFEGGSGGIEGPASGAVCLLEDLSNLLANEMYGKDGALKDPAGEGISDKNIEEVILKPLRSLGATGELVIVSNDIFLENGPEMEYTRILGRLNEALAGIAGQVFEVVSGIAVQCKV